MEPEFLEQRQVVVVVAGQAELPRIARRRVAPIAGTGRRLERIGVEPSIDRPLIARKLGVADYVVYVAVDGAVGACGAGKSGAAFAAAREVESRTVRSEEHTSE